MSKFELPYDAFLRTVKENKDTNHAFLLGAGSSITSGIQSAADCIWEWKKNIFVTKNPGLAKQYSSYKSESVQRSLQKWLDTEGIYPKENSPDEYSYLAMTAYPIDETRRRYFENICKGKEPYIGYKILCQLSKTGLIKSVYTTNFDGLIEKAAHQTGITPISISLANADYVHRASSNSELLCINLHGDFKYGPLKNTSDELDNQHEAFVKSLQRHLYDRHLVVIGYSGRDKSLMDALKKAYAEPGGGMLFWCGYGYNINEDIQDLLEKVKDSGRQGFYVPTEGFDSTMIHIAKTCFEGDTLLQSEVSTLMDKGVEEKIYRTPFSLEINELNVLLRSNLFPISLPREVFQVEVSFEENEKMWATTKELTKNRTLCAVPLKGCVYAFGTQSEIREAFRDKIKSEIRRTPVTYKEIKDGSAFKNLYLATIVKALSEKLQFENNGKNKIWGVEKKEVVVENIKYEVHDGLELGFFFDDRIYSSSPHAYLSVKPTFYIKSDLEIPKSVKFEIGKKYHEELLSKQPNVKFNDQIQKWKGILFPDGNRLQFEFPFSSGTGFKFVISPDTMHVGLMKNSTPRYRLILPPSFNQNTILHKGIQYFESQLEFADKKKPTQIVNDFHPMRGLRDNRPYDFLTNGNIFDPEINLGVICPAGNGQSLFSFLNRLNRTAEAGRNNPDYLLDYPGFVQAYGIPLNVPDTNSVLWKDCSFSSREETPLQAATLLAETIKKLIDQLDASNKKLVIIIFIPSIWNGITDVETEHEKFDLHDYIKAYAAQKQIATQFIQEETLSDSLVCQVNWWLSLSFYVKAQRTPWVLQGLRQDTAFVGIGYSVDKRKERSKVVMGCSHIYNALGQGLKYKLSRIEDCTFDSQNNPYLSYQDAYKFGALIRELFLIAMGDIPKRVVVHKRTYFKPDEIKGIIDSLGKTGIEQIDLIEINFDEDARFVALFSNKDEIKPNLFPLSRGSCFLIDNFTALLWTHGIVPSVRISTNSYFQGGKGIPIPIKVKKHYGLTNINTIANEILGLTKMNWNSFDLYSKLPATIQTSNEIARIGWLLNRFEGTTYDYRNFM